MTACEAGDLVIVPFPFTDLRTAKQRPALVLASLAATPLPDLALVAMVTGQLTPEPLVGDLLIKDWKEAGLLHPTKVRLAKLVSIESRLLVKKLGSLSAADRDGVRREPRRVLAAWG